MSKLDNKMSFKINKEVKEEFEKIMKENEHNPSTILRDFIGNYIKGIKQKKMYEKYEDRIKKHIQEQIEQHTKRITKLMLSMMNDILVQESIFEEIAKKEIGKDDEYFEKIKKRDSEEIEEFFTTFKMK